jgi:hypothetical protein
MQPENNVLLIVGVFSTFATLVIREVLTAIKLRNGGSKSQGETAKGLRTNPADFSVEWDEMLAIMRELRDDARQRAKRRVIQDRGAPRDPS